MSVDYMTSHFDYVYELQHTSYVYRPTSPLPSWLLLESDNNYWTMSSVDDTNKKVWKFSNDGTFSSDYVYRDGGLIRPIVTIKKNSNVKKIEYYIGEKIEYNGNQYYVMDGTEASSKTIKLLKAEPLSFDEVSNYTTGVNNSSGYGAVSYYYSSETCGWGGMYGTAIVSMSCVNSYNESKVKTVVDGWANSNFDSSVHKEARLITKEEYVDLCVEEIRYDTAGEQYTVTVPRNWIFDSRYNYLTMSEYQDSSDYVYGVRTDGEISQFHVGAGSSPVRPVIVINKSALN